MVEGARIRGATKIIGVDLNEKRRSKGEAFGMTDFINPTITTTNSSSSIADTIKELTGGFGVDYCFECTGSAPLLNQALEATKLVFFLLLLHTYAINISLILIIKYHLST